MRGLRRVSGHGTDVLRPGAGPARRKPPVERGRVMPPPSATGATAVAGRQPAVTGSGTAARPFSASCPSCPSRPRGASWVTAGAYGRRSPFRPEALGSSDGTGGVGEAARPGRSHWRGARRHTHEGAGRVRHERLPGGFRGPTVRHPASGAYRFGAPPTGIHATRSGSARGGPGQLTCRPGNRQRRSPGVRRRPAVVRSTVDPAGTGRAVSSAPRYPVAPPHVGMARFPHTEGV